MTQLTIVDVVADRMTVTVPVVDYIYGLLLVGA